ncbi:hypothetical protein DDT56_07075 [Brenneria corticis]|uniref:Uncharacterized protein n=1 Tax=Brenneria corticis TaxID=2173106 RepID=A0A2U1U6J0_9GAMM|nr:hypothetical protein DDT56_07075 [Brenneria sp. CFCC 11842]
MRGLTPPQPPLRLSLIHKSKEPLEAMCILVLGSFLVLGFLLFVGVRNHAEVDDPANAPKASRQRRDFSHSPGPEGGGA